jgi:DNA mismatch repair protein MutS
MKDDTVTPIRQQYLDIKKQYPDAILFFRLGDFYETFDEDARITSRELDIVLTSRNVAKGVRIPMAGIPHHAADNYLARLIEKGFHVAICEQVGEQPVKGLFPRKVTRVVTPGTIFEPELLHGDQNNYLVCICPMENRAGIAYADITTGEFAVTEIESPDILAGLRAEMLRLKPAEILHPEGLHFNGDLPGHTSSWPTWRFELNRCDEALKSHFEVSVLDGFGLRGKSLSIRAAGGLIQYLTETQPASLKLLRSLFTYSLNEFMTLDAATRRNLELTETIRQGDARGSLLHVLDHTVTPMGKRLMRQWVSKPLLDIDVIENRQNGVTFFLQNGLLRAELRETLSGFADLERLSNRVVSGSAVPRDLVSIRATIECLPTIISLFPNNAESLQPAIRRLRPCERELHLLQQAINDDPPATLQNTGVIRAGFSPDLDQVMASSAHAREWISGLEAAERERTGIKTLKVGYNKVFGYYIEVTRANTENVPEEYIRKQTLVNAERYITPELKEYETLVLNASDRIHEIEARIFRQVCADLATSSESLLETARAISELDVLASLAETAALNNYARPRIVAEPILKICDGRHPVVELTLRSERFVPNDTIFEEGEIVRVITGPNMSGKSTYLRQVALLVLMAQMGSFIPVQSAEIGLVDRIFTRIGAQDEIHAGQSTFMVEMIETANILNNASNRSLLILDEVGRGTSTYDGVSIAWAMIEYLHNHPALRARTLFATHYHELTQLSDLLPGVRNYNVAVSESEGKVIFLHKIVSGGADRSYGIHVAQLAGIPKPVIQRASEILKQLETTSGKAVHINPQASKQMALFPETNPLLKEIEQLDLNAISPIEALNKLYEWQKQFIDKR